MDKPVIDQTMYVARDGAVWHESHWMVQTSLEGPEPFYRTVEIKDGTDESKPFVVYVMPDVPRETNQ
jgi:hypothetical protein